MLCERADFDFRENDFSAVCIELANHLIRRFSEKEETMKLNVAHCFCELGTKDPLAAGVLAIGMVAKEVTK